MYLSNSLLPTVLLSISSRSVWGQASNAPSTGTRSTPATGAAGTSGAASLAAGLSSGCQTAAGGLLTTEFSSCANVIGLVSLIGAQGAVLEPLNAWITGVCSASPCSNSTLTSTASSLSSGCSGDVQQGVPAAVALTNVINNYNAVRNMLCTQYATNSTFCVPSVLGNIQTATGKNLTIAEIQNVVSGGIGMMSLASVPAGAYCNDCGHALLTQSNALSVKTPTTSNGTTTSTGANSALSQQCGASFADGKLPSSVRIAGGNASGDAKNGAAGREKASLFGAVSAFVLAATIGMCVM